MIKMLKGQNNAVRRTPERMVLLCYCFACFCLSCVVVVVVLYVCLCAVLFVCFLWGVEVLF